MTYLELVNKVLVRLRETQVSTVASSAYSSLIGEFVNETKREVEDSWHWVLLRDTIQVNTSSGTFRYTLTGAGNRFRLLHAFNDTDNVEMKLIPSREMTQLHNGSDTQYAQPLYFDFNGNTSGDPNVDLWPVPDGSYALNFDMVIPQDDLSSDDDVLTVPEWPVILGAWAKAISERGEDGSTQYAEVEARYRAALSDAIAIDASNLPFEKIWDVV